MNCLYDLYGMSKFLCFWYLSKIGMKKIDVKNEFKNGLSH